MKRLVFVVSSALLLAGCSAIGGSGTAPAVGGSSAADLNAVKSTELASYITREEVTPENWQNYFTADVEHNVILDAFGEDVGEYEEGVALRIGENYIAGNELVMRFIVDSTVSRSYIDSQTGEPVVYEWNSDEKNQNTYDILGPNLTFSDKGYYMIEGSRASRNNGWDVNNDGVKDLALPSYTLDNLEMVKSIGSVILFDLPEDKWMTDDDGIKFFRIENEETGNYGEYYMNGATKIISKNGEVLSYSKAKKNAPEYSINQLFNGKWGLGSLLETDE